MSYFFIPGNVPSSKGSRVWTGRYFVDSAATKRWKKETKELWESYQGLFCYLTEGREYPWFIHLTFIRRTRLLFDYINAAQVVMDSMTKYNWINDDNAELVVPVFGKFEYDKNGAGVIIRVLAERPQYQFL